MRGSDLPEASRWRFTEAVPTVDAQSCLNSRHKAAACTRCVAACPVQAIALTGGTPILDDEQCVSCGVCQVACPTAVFHAPPSVEARLVQTVAQTTADVLLVCPQNPTPDRTAAPVEVVVRHKRCLAALAAADLLSLAQPQEQTEGRAIWLDDHPCATCPLAAAQPALHASVASAQTLLATLKLQSSIHRCRDHPELASRPTTRHPVLDGMQPKIARRRLFGLGDRTPLAAGEAAQVAADEIGVGKRVPPTHQRLVAQVRRLLPVDETPVAARVLPFAGVEIETQACSACGLCAHFCPTGALRFAADGQAFALHFHADRCIGCDLCQLACPEDAIHVHAGIAAPRLLAAEAWSLVKGELAACSVCGAATAAHGDTPLCHSCRHGAGVVTTLRDDAGLMADLLSRLPA